MEPNALTIVLLVAICVAIGLLVLLLIRKPEGHAEAAMRDLRRTSATLRQMTESIQNQGAGSLLKGKKLPDYKP